MKKSILFACLLITVLAFGQNAYKPNFIDYQKSFPRTSEALRKKEDTLMKQFIAKGLEWPARYLYIRSFKYDSQLEVWVKNERNAPYKLFKTYKVCAMAGSLGPKRMQGDYQVPEGFYYINEFNPKSTYHLSLGLNYPNASDRYLSDMEQPGGDIYIHGSCVTTGCIPITDVQIEELYVLAAYAKAQGQDFIPVHIFPVNFNNQRSVDYLSKYLRDFADYGPLAKRLKEVFYYFEQNKQLPVIMVNTKGNYVVDEDVAKAVPNKLEKLVTPAEPVVKKERVKVPFNENEIPTTVTRLPEFPGGSNAFKNYLNGLNKDLSCYLSEDQHTAYILVEFIVDKAGNIVNPRILKGGNDRLNEHLLDALETMPKWNPAVKQQQTVPMKLKQTILIESRPAA